MEKVTAETTLPITPMDGAVLDQLRREHRELEERLSELNSHLYLTPDEQVEKKRIQKLKLQKKDRILSILSGGRVNSA